MAKFVCFIEYTLGEEEYVAIREHNLRSGEGFLFMFSVTSRISFDKISAYICQVQKCKENQSSFPRVLMGNKCELKTEREISTEEGEELARELNCPYFETSAKETINIEESFFELVREMRRVGGCIPK